jgi:hypothetical protein
VCGGALPGATALGSLTAAQGVTLIGKSASIGALISHAGDVNGDGIPDLLVSGASSYGRVYAVLGSKILKSAAIDDVPGLFQIQSGAPNELLPLSLDYVGKVDADDKDEIAMTSRSSVAMVLGASDAYPADTDKLTFSGKTGGGWRYTLLTQSALQPATVAGAGNVDNDPGHSADLLICETDKTSAISCRVVFGPPAKLDAGWNIVGFSELPRLAHGADLNGDGFSDVLFGAGSQVYVALGKRSGFTDVDVNFLGSNGFTLSTEAGSRVDSVVTLGDVNGDGAPDYAVGDSTANSGAGSVFVVFGSK